MPRIDPVTGCSVMTVPEFLQKEAEAEGKEPHEILDEIFDVIEDDNEKMRQDMRTNALKYLQEEAKEQLHCWTEDSKHHGQVDEYNRFDSATQQYVLESRVYDAGPRPPQPVALVEVKEADFSQTFRSSKSKLVAKCFCDDNAEHTFTLCRADWAGSMLEPPDCDIQFNWE